MLKTERGTAVRVQTHEADSSKSAHCSNYHRIIAPVRRTAVKALRLIWSSRHYPGLAPGACTYTYRCDLLAPWGYSWIWPKLFTMKNLHGPIPCRSNGRIQKRSPRRPNNSLETPIFTGRRITHSLKHQQRDCAHPLEHTNAAMYFHLGTKGTLASTISICCGFVVKTSHTAQIQNKLTTKRKSGDWTFTFSPSLMFVLVMFRFSSAIATSTSRSWTLSGLNGCLLARNHISQDAPHRIILGGVDERVCAGVDKCSEQGRVP